VFAFFENLVDPYPSADPGRPPDRFWPFIYFYSRPLIPWLVALAVLAALASAIELTFFAYIGDLVD
jgi:ATP-binding cassette subfamily B multidrug efflux pump